MDAMRMVAILEYDGSRFSGWQRQEGARTVQGCVEEALSRVAAETIAVTVAGRTDAGVHACGQVIHFDTWSTRADHSWLRGANSNLPREIAVRWVAPVDVHFHARYSATGREYRYAIINRAVRPTYLSGRVTHEYRPLDVARMRAAAAYLIGEHDFSSFRAAECQARHPVRDLRALEVERHGEFIMITARANAFLHHMVRNLVGVLADIGAGEKEPSWAKEVLEARDRTVGGITAPPDGLYLTAIEYPPTAGVPVFPPVFGLW